MHASMGWVSCGAATLSSLHGSVETTTSSSAQDDLLYESLTVYETLYFAAMLRLPSSMTRAQKAARVADVVQSLGLGRCKDTIIGAPLPEAEASARVVELRQVLLLHVHCARTATPGPSSVCLTHRACVCRWV